jgi:HPt (histidine-containing phosphotransfer) domain-containing protein
MNKESTIIPSPPSSSLCGITDESMRSTSQSGEPLWDVSECLQQLDCEADAEILHDVITAFMDDSRVRIEELRQAARRGWTTELREQVHSLKGSSNQVGAKQMAALCKHIEQCCSDGSGGELPLLLDQLATIFLSTSQAMVAHADANCRL